VVTVEATDPVATRPVTRAPALDTGTFTIRRSTNLLVPLTVSFTRSTGSGLVNGVDYDAFGTSVTIPAGQAAATVTVVPHASAQAPAEAALMLTLSPSTAYVVGTAADATVLIRSGP